MTQKTFDKLVKLFHLDAVIHELLRIFFIDSGIKTSPPRCCNPNDEMYLVRQRMVFDLRDILTPLLEKG